MTSGGSNPAVFIAGVNSVTPEVPGSAQNFVNRLITLGFKVESDPYLAEFFICVDHCSTDLRIARKAGITREQSVLVRNEPTVVNPENRDSVVQKEYALILDMGRPTSKSKNSIPWPQVWTSLDSEVPNWKARKDRVILINANKISFLPGELYSLRRATLREFDSIDLFGQGWNMNTSERFKHYVSNLWIALKSGQIPRFSGGKYYFYGKFPWKGSPDDKRQVARNYRYALVIENSREFITEKLFDSLFSGCIPVYVGPSLEEFGIPKSLYVQAEDNLDSIKMAISSVQKIEYQNWIELRNEWLSRDDVKNFWSSEAVNLRIVSELKKFMRLT